jgi:hypothetical protein
VSADAVRELTIEYFCDEERRLSAECHSYRLALLAALDAAHQLTQEADQLREENRRLRDWNNQMASAFGLGGNDFHAVAPSEAA